MTDRFSRCLICVVYEGKSNESSLTRAPATMVGQTFTSMLVDDIDDAEDDGNSDDDVSLAVLAGRVTKRKRAPPTKGPCEHGVKQRSKCKVCSGCPHGRRRSQCKECGGGSICEHGRERSKCKECGGSQICEHGRVRSRCKECKK